MANWSLDNEEAVGFEGPDHGKPNSKTLKPTQCLQSKAQTPKPSIQRLLYLQ